jgi:RNA-binding protein
MLNSKQRKSLKVLAHKLKPITNVGKSEISEDLVKAVKKALFDHELIKVKILKTVTLPKQEVAEALAQAADAEMVNLIGHTIILYKRTDKEGFENIDIGGH